MNFLSAFSHFFFSHLFSKEATATLSSGFLCAAMRTGVGILGLRKCRLIPDSLYQSSMEKVNTRRERHEGMGITSAPYYKYVSVCNVYSCGLLLYQTFESCHIRNKKINLC